MAEATVLAAYHAATCNPATLPDLDHVCGNGCGFWEATYEGCRVFVCRASRCLHWCGQHCQRVSLTGADEVCTLTGHVIQAVPLVYQHLHSKSSRRMVQRVSGRGTGISARAARNERVRRWVERAADAILASVKRGEVRRRHVDKARRRAKRVLGSAGSTFSKVQAQVALVCIRAGPTLHKACCRTSYTLVVLKRRLVAYVTSFPNLKLNERHVTAFTAACIQRLTKGWTVAGVEMFPLSAFAAAHAPAEISHTELCNVPCRQVSAAHRLIVTESVGPSGLPRLGLRF